MSEEMERRIAGAYGDQVVRARPEVLQRILDRRARGDRVTLEPPSRPVPWIYGIIAAGLAAMLLLIPKPPGPDDPAGTTQARLGQLAERMLMPGQLVAQGSGSPSFAPAVLSREIRPGEWAYAVLVGGNSYDDSMLVHHVRLEASRYGGEPAWLLLNRSARRNAESLWKDTTFMARSDLRLLARSFVVGGNGRITEEYREHEMLRGYMIGGTTSWNVIALDSTDDGAGNGFSFQSDALTMALQQAPLARDWSGSVQLRSLPSEARIVLRWLDLAVVGEERVRVPAGEFDCWKVRLGPSGRDPDSGFFFWVSKDLHWLVQQGVEGGPQGTRWRSVLVSGRED